MAVPKKSSTFASQFSNGTLADRLGNGLQNRVEQFDSARYLNPREMDTINVFIFFYTPYRGLLMKNICIRHYPSPCGELLLASTDHELCMCCWAGMACAERSLRRIRRYMNVEFTMASSAVIEQTVNQLDDYFAGHLTAFNIPLHPVGTDFQHRVWKALLDIPFGQTRSYMEIAKSIGNPQGVRAVAQAIGANGIGIIIPCHRVIGSNHSLTGFAGGLDKKQLLLQLERTISMK